MVTYETIITKILLKCNGNIWKKHYQNIIKKIMVTNEKKLPKYYFLKKKEKEILY